VPKAKIYEKVYDVLKGILFPNARGGVLVLLCRSGGGAAFAQDCFAVRNRPQPSATVGVANDFWRFEALCNAVCGTCGTSWHSHEPDKVSKVDLCDRHNTFERFSEDDLHFSWQVQHLGRVHAQFARDEN
jgi:hypothetical protein